MSAATALADRCLAVSPYVRDFMTERSMVPQRKMRMVLNGMDPPKPPSKRELAAFLAQLGVPKNALCAGTVGRLFDDCKRVSDLIQAFAKLPPEIDGRPLALIVGGEGPDRGELERLAQALGVGDRVFFAGYLSNPSYAYAALELFCLASSFEAFGLVLVEAMASNLALVGTRVGGIPSIIEHGTNGLLVPPHDPDALAEAMGQLLADPARRAQMGAKGREMALEKYTTERYIERIGAFYQELRRAF